MKISEDLQLYMQGNDESDEESFNKQAPSYHASNSDCAFPSTVPTIACYIQDSDDLLRESVRSLNANTAYCL